jgi:SWI/SNF-RSC chromatin remodeling complexes subunit Ssr4-like protein
MHPSGFSPTSNSINFGNTPLAQPSAIPSSAATPAHLGATSPQVPQPTIPEEDAMEGVTMDNGAGDGLIKTEAGAQGSSGDDWVVVPKGGVSPDPTSTAVAKTEQSAPAERTPSGEGNTAGTTSIKGSAAGTPAVGDLDSVAFDGEADNNDFSSLGDLDTAADALAGYDAPALDGDGGDLGEGLDLSMDMEDSAFGDAFHGVNESRDGDGTTPAHGEL